MKTLHLLFRKQTLVHYRSGSVQILYLKHCTPALVYKSREKCSGPSQNQQYHRPYTKRYVKNKILSVEQWLGQFHPFCFSL